MSINAQTIANGCKKYPVLVISGVISIILLATIYTRYDLVDDQRDALEKYLAESARHKANIVNATHLKEEVDLLKAANKTFQGKALTADGLAQNLQYFYRLEADTGVKFLDLRAGSRATNSKAAIYIPLNYVVNAQGSFAQVITLLRKLEHGSHFCRINSATTANNNGLVTLNLNLDLLGVP